MPPDFAFSDLKVMPPSNLMEIVDRQLAIIGQEAI
jgi:hypothetical protein